MKKNTIAKSGLLILLALALLGTGLYFINRQEKNDYAEARSEMSEGFGQLKRIKWDDVTYREKPAVTTLLVVGIDKAQSKEEKPDENFRNGGQADFIMLIAIDHTDKKIHQLQIDRDTMAEIDILGIFGNEVGTRTEQICLSHSFGETPEDNAKYTVKAVERILNGLEIDGYYMIDYSSVGVINDALGGVKVNIDFDMTSINQAWTKGSEITLHGKEAEEFVRSRMTIGEGTNEERMVRQNEFMKNAISMLKKKASEDISFTETLLEQLRKLSTTNITSKRLSEEVYKSRNYIVEDVEYLEGEYITGSDGYIEFHMKEGSAVQWVLKHLYTKIEE